MRKVVLGLVMIAMTASCANGSNKQQATGNVQEAQLQQEQISASQQGSRVEAPDFELNDIPGDAYTFSFWFNAVRVISAGIAIGLCSQGNFLGTILFVLL